MSSSAVRFLDVHTSGASMREGAVANLTRTITTQVEWLEQRRSSGEVLRSLNGLLRGRSMGTLRDLREMTDPEIVARLVVYPSLFRGVREALGLSIPELDRLERMAGGGHTLQELGRGFRPERIGLLELGPYLCFSHKEYQRTWYSFGNGAEILILCWMPGQRTRIHDHGRHRGMDAVLMGEMREHLSRRDRSGRIRHYQTLTHRPGDIVIIGAQRIHYAENPAGSSSPLVSVHLYLDPLLRV